MKRARIISVDTPAALPVSVADMKAHLRVTHSLEDDLIEVYISAAAASIGVDGDLGVAIGAQTISEALQYPERDVYLSVPPAQSLVALTYYDTDNVLQTADLADFEFYTAPDWAFVRSESWPTAYDRPDAFKITYTAGVDAIAPDILHALKMIVGHWYQNRADTSTETIKELPRAVDHLLGLHRVGWYG